MRENNIYDSPEDDGIVKDNQLNEKDVTKVKDTRITANLTSDENIPVKSEEDSSQSTKAEKIIKEIKSYCVIVVAAVLVAVFVNSFILSNTRIPTGSMENTINCEDRLFGNRLAYKFKEVQRGDIIIFKFPDDRNIRYIKRVIGIPGDTVHIKDGVLYLNGDVVEESYIKEPMQGTFGPYEVPQASYFVMGDNRNNSNDARFWANTYVPEKDIIAKAVFRYWPSFKMVK